MCVLNLLGVDIDICDYPQDILFIEPNDALYRFQELLSRECLSQRDRQYVREFMDLFVDYYTDDPIKEVWLCCNQSIESILRHIFHEYSITLRTLPENRDSVKDLRQIMGVYSVQ